MIEKQTRINNVQEYFQLINSLQYPCDVYFKIDPDFEDCGFIDKTFDDYGLTWGFEDSEYLIKYDLESPSDVAIKTLQRGHELIVVSREFDEDDYVGFVMGRGGKTFNHNFKTDQHTYDLATESQIRDYYRRIKAQSTQKIHS